MLKRHNPISKVVDGGLVTSVSASCPNIVLRPVRQTSSVAAPEITEVPASATVPASLIAFASSPRSAAHFSTG